MNINKIQSVSAEAGTHRYPISHWDDLRQFVTGDERDPKDLFSLAEDSWDVWPYAAHGMSSRPCEYRFRFGHLRSFLKPYVKWYCYQRLLGRAGIVSRHATIIPNLLTRADMYLIDNNCQSLDDIASEADFAALWEAQLLPQKDSGAAASRASVRLQRQTHSFWIHLRLHFHVPQVIPPVAPYQQWRLSEAAFDEHQLIPLPVIRQLVNKLALHRKGHERLNSFHHLRLCVLALALALGRRITEILTAPRGLGPDGPLTYYPARESASQGGLWFQFSPNKEGPEDQVYVSPEWEDIAKYCVREVLSYSDEIRSDAPPEVRNFFILISRKNRTSGPMATLACPGETRPVEQRKQDNRRKDVYALTYEALRLWLNDHISSGTANKQIIPGILNRWKISADGSADGEIYQLRTHQARHTRQSAIASDPRVPPLGSTA